MGNLYNKLEIEEYLRSNPNDKEVLEVYSDILMAKGNPRGEIIAYWLWMMYNFLKEEFEDSLIKADIYENQRKLFINKVYRKKRTEAYINGTVRSNLFGDYQDEGDLVLLGRNNALFWKYQNPNLIELCGLPTTLIYFTRGSSKFLDQSIKKEPTIREIDLPSKYFRTIFETDLDDTIRDELANLELKDNIKEIKYIFRNDDKFQYVKPRNITWPLRKNK